MNTTMPAGDITTTITKTQWKQIVAEDFKTPVALGSWPGPYAPRWFTYPVGWHDTSGRGHYNPGVISVHDSCVDYFLHVDSAGVPQVACISPILPGLAVQKGLLYQRWACRFKIDPTPGFKAAWLFWPDSETWPRDGEIDFPEADLDKPIHGYVHLQNGTSGSDQAAYASTVLLGSGWHIAETIWSPGGVEFKLDGGVVGNYTGTRIPNTPMHIDLQCETSLDGEMPAAGASAHVLIDWCVVYAWEGN